MQGVLAEGCELEPVYEKLLSMLQTAGHSGNILYKMLHNWATATPPLIRSTHKKKSILKKASQTSEYILP